MIKMTRAQGGNLPDSIAVVARSRRQRSGGVADMSLSDCLMNLRSVLKDHQRIVPVGKTES